MTTELEVEHEVRRTVTEYCRRIDDADLEGFAALFRHGRWFMVETLGSDAVLAWLRAHVVLHDGHTYTRHEVTNLVVDLADDDTATFGCYVAIWLDLPDATPQLLAHARFAGTFRRVDGAWWWATHVVTPTFVGDLGQHMRTAPTS